MLFHNLIALDRLIILAIKQLTESAALVFVKPWDNLIIEAKMIRLSGLRMDRISHLTLPASEVNQTLRKRKKFQLRSQKFCILISLYCSKTPNPHKRWLRTLGVLTLALANGKLKLKLIPSSKSPQLNGNASAQFKALSTSLRCSKHGRFWFKRRLVRPQSEFNFIRQVLSKFWVQITLSGSCTTFTGDCLCSCGKSRLQIW